MNPISWRGACAKLQAAVAFALLCGAIPTAARAAAPPRIENVLIGLRGGQGVSAEGQSAGRSRNGVWAPVQVTLKAGADDVTSGSYRLVVETDDGEAVPYRYTAPVPAIPANGEQLAFVYVRPGSTGSTFTLTLQTADGRDVQTRDRLQRDPSVSKSEVLEPRDVLYLTVGSRLPGLKRALLEPDKPAEAGEAGGEAAEEPEDRGKQRFAYVENIAALPDRWFGYEAVDVLLLTTSGDTFVKQLLDMSKARRGALLDWVRRGGKVVLSVGRNQQAVARWLEKVPLIDGTLTGKRTRSSLPSIKRWSGEAPQKQPPRQVEIALVKPGPNTRTIVQEDPEAGDLEPRPVISQSSCGLGRVILVAFDLDAPPFSTWSGQSAFWKRLQAEIAPREIAANPAQLTGMPGQTGELGAELKRVLETFDEVPVISFGWVALFILFYIILVGPLDYLLLKKVFKRLELTWITFPVLVLVVSVAAYATAYYFKGDDLRVNKIDLVEIDLDGPGQVYGTSWFTLFSPRIQNYTVGLEPVAPEWGGRWDEEDADAPAPPVMVATLDGPEASLGGNSQSLFRRPYEYADDAGGLRRVPIPVWATRTFTASWRVPLRDRRERDRPPPIVSEVRISRDDQALTGAITNNLPAELQGTMLFFRGKGYLLGDLMPGDTRDVSPLFERSQPLTPQQWVSKPDALQQRPSSMPSGRQRSVPHLGSYGVLRPLLFHDVPGFAAAPNSGLRYLDESWRLLPPGDNPRQGYRDEIILIARTPPRTDKAEAVTQDGVSPTRLWLDHLPGTRPQRPALSGYLQQETYVRIYIPLVRGSRK